VVSSGGCIPQVAGIEYDRVQPLWILAEAPRMRIREHMGAVHAFDDPDSAPQIPRQARRHLWRRAKIRATSLSVSYNPGVGILGGFLPFVASALVIYAGNIFAGLWYSTGIALATAIVGLIVLPETRGRPLD
jgi:hypothetical protein